MHTKTINAIEVLDTGEVILIIEGPRDPAYQYVYREAAGVYWDEKRHGFKSTEMKEWGVSTWFEHIVAVVELGLGLKLSLGGNVHWNNVPAADRQAIERRYAP